MLKLKTTIFSLSLCVFLVFSTAPRPARAWVVFDPANFVQAVQQVAQQVIDYSMQVSHDIALWESYYTDYQNLMLYIENLKEFTDKDYLLDQIKGNLTEIVGNSLSIALYKLDRTSSNYEANRDSILSMYYTLPLDQAQVNASVSNMLPTDQAAYKQDYARENEQWNRYVDVVDQVNFNAEVTENRNKNIADYASRLQNLGPNSELETAQLQATQIQLGLQQNEDTFKVLNNLLMVASDERMKEISQTKYYQNKRLQELQKNTSSQSQTYGSDSSGITQ